MMHRVLFYGDSNTYGFDPQGAFGGRFPESVRWTSVLERRLIGEWEIIADGMNGREIPHTFEAWEHLDSMITQCSPLTLFVVMLGTNDYLNMFVPNVDLVADKIKTLLEHVLAFQEIRENQTRCLLISPPMIRTAGDDYYAKYDTTAGQFARAFRQVASKLHVSFADAAAWQLPMAYDGVHFSEEAHLIFADRVEEMLRFFALGTERI